MFGFSVHSVTGWSDSEGKFMAAFAHESVQDLTTLSHSPPGEHVSILPCMLCGMVPVSPAGIRGRCPKKLDTCAIQTGSRQVKHLPIFALDDTNTVYKAVAGPPQLAFFRSVVPEGVCHRAITVNQQLNA